jgi:acetyl-CoA synthetase
MDGLREHAIRDARTFEEARERFRWRIPKDYSIVKDALERHLGSPDAVGLIYEDDDGRVSRYSWGQLDRLSRRLANALRALGVARGDTVALSLGQRPEMALAFFAVWRLGAIAVPISRLFGIDGLHFRLRFSAAKVLMIEPDDVWKLEGIAEQAPGLKHIIQVQARGEHFLFDDLLDKGSEDFTPDRESRPDDPVLLCFTSGTTGEPKAVVQAAHWLPALTGVDYLYNYIRDDDVYYGVPDWTWMGGIFSLFSAWALGTPALAWRPVGRFDAERMIATVARHGATFGMYPPSVLRPMREIPNLRRKYADLRLRCVALGAEAVTPDLAAWTRDELGIDFNLGYGQTEAVAMIGSCSMLEPDFPLDSIGRALPGHEMAVLSEDNAMAAPGVTGEIAVRLPNPSVMIGYLNNPEATAKRFAGGWMRTGDMGYTDERGFFYFRARADDMIKCSGYRVGPVEIEAKIVQHPAVAACIVIGVADAIRGQAIKAYVRLLAGHAANEETRKSIQEFVRKRLAAYEYPRHVEFVDEFPMTVTGKVRRTALRAEEGGQGSPTSAP